MRVMGLKARAKKDTKCLVKLTARKNNINGANL
jgi:hypothetical protein